MRVTVKRSVLAAGMLCALTSGAAAQTESRSFAAPALRAVPANDPYGRGAEPPAEAVPATSIAPPLAAVPSPPAVDPSPPTEAAPGSARRAARKPTPQWPLTAEDLAERQRTKVPASGPSEHGTSTGPTASQPAPLGKGWPTADVMIAKARCATLLKDVAAIYIPMEPMREGDCGTPAPVQLLAVGKNPQVVISPPAVVTCDLVVALHSWLQKDIQPSARKLLGSPIVKIENMSSYSCRNAYGRAKTRLSEHGRANALDIRGFVTASGQGPELLADWGPTMRDVRAQEIAAARAAAAKAAAARVEAGQKTSDTGVRQAVETGTIPGGVGTLIEGVPAMRAIAPARPPQSPDHATTFAPASRLGAPKSGEASAATRRTEGTQVATAPDAQAPVDTRRSQFLRQAHISACKTFNTVLGPEANNAHRNHFHIDMAERTSGPFCE
jgi:hypothetical protein